MHILERFVAAKTGDPLECEDVIAVTPHFAAIFDGASGSGGQACRGGGRIAAQTAAAALRNLPAESEGRFAIDYISERLALLNSRNQKRLLPAGCDRPRTCAVIFSSQRREIWRVGDSAFAIDADVYTRRTDIDAAVYGARAAYLYAMLAAGHELDRLRAIDPSKPIISSILRIQPALVNVESPFGYGALDGSRVPARYVEVYPLPVNVKTITFASDGYPELCPTLNEAEERLRRVAAEDPLCIRLVLSPEPILPGRTAYDDRAWLRLAMTTS